jgi:hypothetical protein
LVFYIAQLFGQLRQMLDLCGILIIQDFQRVEVVADLFEERDLLFYLRQIELHFKPDIPWDEK